MKSKSHSPAARNEPSQISLVKSLRQEQCRSWQSGVRVTAETILGGHPDLQFDQEATLELVYNEILLREELNEAPALEEYQRRFPALAERLALLFTVHAALEDEPAGGDESAAELPQIRGYDVLREIGRGGMAVVYEARQRGVNRRVALKMLLAGDYAGLEERSRFRTEAEALGRLHHPHIVPVHEVGEHNGRPYLVMELVEGGSLARLLAGTPLSAPQAAGLVEQLARAIHYAHEQGVVHRDLKPANILLVSGGVGQAVTDGTKSARPSLSYPKITDFGLAKLLATEAGHTQTGAVIGTPSYMAPEQAQGRSRDIGPAADIYALGAILYELLTGRPPFRAETPLETMHQALVSEPVSPSRLRTNLSRDLTTICLKCLEREPGRRYATAAALAEDLRRFQADEPIVARRVGAPARAWRWSRRNPKVAGLAALACILLVVIAVGSFAAALSLRQSARDRQWEAKVAEARLYRFSNLPGQRFKALDALAEASHIRPDAELCNEAIAALSMLDLRVVKEWPGYPPGALHVAFDGRLQRYARSHSSGGAISVRRVEDDVEIYPLPGPGPSFLRFSEDGQFLAVVSSPSGRVRVWSLSAESPQLLPWDDVSASEDATIDFDADSRRLAVARPNRTGPNGTVRVHDLVSGEREEFPVGTYRRCVAFRPGGLHLAVAGADGIQVRDARTGKVLIALPDAKAITWLAWHPDGDLLAAVEGDLKIGLWDVRSRRRIRLLEGPRSGGVWSRFSRGGDLLIADGWDSVLRVWDPYSGRLLFSAPFGLPRGTNIDPSDRLLPEIYNENLRLREVARSPSYRTLVGKSGPPEKEYRSVAMGAPGQARTRLLAVGAKGGVSLWDLATATEVGWLPISLSAVRTEYVLFDGDGALLTSGPSGVRRYPVAVDPEPSGDAGQPSALRVAIGPGQLLPLPASDCQLAASRDGKVIALAMRYGALVLHQDRSEKAIVLSPHGDCRYVAVSPDGRWVATGGHTSWGVKIWSASGGPPIKELKTGAAGVGFSPDGRWLLTAAGDRLWQVGSWDEGPRCAPQGAWVGFAFSPEGRVVTHNNYGGLIHLRDVETGREYARLQYPDGALTVRSTFSLDGTRLVAVNDAFQAVHVWDLEALGRELAAAGLDWKLPLAATTVARGADIVPLKVTIQPADQKDEWRHELDKIDKDLAGKPKDPDLHARRGRLYYQLSRLNEALGELSRALELRRDAQTLVWRGRTYRALNKNAEAAADWRAALEIQSVPADEAMICNNLAWFLAAGPADVRSPEEALKLASRAVRISPKQSMYMNTLGVAYYRLGRFDEAAETLRRNLEQSDHSAHDLYFLAMTFRQLAQAVKARDYYTQAEYWLSINEKSLEPPIRAELESIRSEANALGLR
jgi:WD40 repeat protein/tetratricopeptide (TPR) repeat protein